MSGSRLPYRIHFHEFDQDSLGKILETDKFTVYARSWITLFSALAIVSCKRTWKVPGCWKLKAAGVPFGPLLEKSKMARMLFGRRYWNPRQQTISPAPRPGKIITILGDTRKTNASVRLGINADILVHESTYGKGDEKIARNHGHSTNMQAAQVAVEAGANASCSTISVPVSSQKISSKLKKDAASILKMSMGQRLGGSGNLAVTERISMPTILITGASGGLAKKWLNFCQMTNSSLLGRNKGKISPTLRKPSLCRIDWNWYYRWFSLRNYGSRTLSPLC